MGKILIIKGADFSANGIKEDFTIFKNYAFTQSVGQFVNLCQLANLNKYDFSNFKIEIGAKLVAFAESDQRGTPIFGTQHDYITLAGFKDGSAHLNGNASELCSKTIELNKDVVYMLDTKANKAIIDGTEFSFSVDWSTGVTRTILNIFSFSSTSINDKAGRVRVRYVKVWNPTSGELLCDIKPAIVNDNSGMYDTISKTMLTANSGMIGIE